MSTYEPGTIAIATVRGVEGVRVGRVGSKRPWWVSFEPVSVSLPNGMSGPQCIHDDRHVTNVVRLLVLEDVTA